jgi:hypothetical protein
MGDTEQPQAEEAQPEAQEGQQQEAPAEEAPPEGAEAKPEEGAEEEKPEGQEEARAEEKHRRAGGWQRKIERLERELEMERQFRAQLQQGTQQPAKEKSPEEKAAEYLDGLVSKRLAERDAQQQQAAQQAEFQRRAAEVRAAHPDFDEVVLAADAPVSPALQEALLTSDSGPAIMYQLAKSPAELARLSALPPLAAAREIGRLEAKLASSTSAPKPKSAARPPAPPTSVNGSASSTRSLDDLPLSEYKRAYRSGRR